MAFLTVYVLCTIGLNSSMTFYDAMLPDVTTDERMDAVSSSGYAWGYIGSTVPFVICLALIMGGPALGVPTMLATRLSLSSLVPGGSSLPCRSFHYKQKYGRERGPQDTIGHIVGGVFSEVGHTMREIAHNKTVLMFMIAFFFYIDGVHTVISMATSYGSALGIDSTQLVLALLVTQFVAFPSAIIYGKLAGRVGTLNMILVAVAAYMGIVLFAAFF
ncbi:MAG: MFS transporter [Collinsella sp.]